MYFCQFQKAENILGLGILKKYLDYERTCHIVVESLKVLFHDKPISGKVPILSRFALPS